MKEDNEIDQLFKDGLHDPEIPFNKMDWKNMEHKLDAQKKKRIVPLWMITVSGIAASLVVVLIWVFSNQSNDRKDVIVNAKSTVAPDNAKNELNNHNALSKPNSEVINTTDPTPTVRGVGPEKESLSAAANDPRVIFPGINLSNQRLNPSVAVNDIMKVNTAKTLDQKVNLNVHFIPQRIDSNAIIVEKANALAQSKDDPFERNERFKERKLDRDALTRSIQKRMNASLAQNHNLVLSAMAAPDVSTAKDSKSSKLSSNLGMLATYALGKRISLTSGAIYSKKYYNSAGVTTTANNYADAATPWEVSADCNVLDIPLNVNYKILNNKKLSVSFNTGLSSYFMLKEKYEIVTDQPNGAKNVSNIEINNENQHLFGVANVSVSFDHQISNTVSVGVQPFAKLPLTGIGNGDVRLKSAGVSFSLSIGLFPAKKPGSYASLR